MSIWDMITEALDAIAHEAHVEAWDIQPEDCNACTDLAERQDGCYD